MTMYGLIAGPLALALVLAFERNGDLGLAVFALVPVSMMFSIRQYVAHTAASVDQLRVKNEELSRLAEALKRTHRDTVAALSRSIEAKDMYTGGHVERVAALSVGLGRRLGFEGDDLEAIEIGALLHDIGKLGMPESILNKPAPLTEEEWVVMRRHPLISETILSEVSLHPFVRQIARSSHERIDGKGYPDRLHGEAIPLAARVVLVADAYDALTSTRAYRAARSSTEALAEIRANAGTQFCADVVAALEAIAREEPALLDAVESPPLRVVA
jgi:HD-GYP domain-containing protein (c-di-GMP phosphodiesterase class II)